MSDLRISYTGGDADKHAVEMRSLALSLLNGRKREADTAMDVLAKFRAIEAQERVEMQRQWLEHEAGWRDQLFGLANRLAAPAIKAVTPVGPSVDHLRLDGKSPPFVVDLPTADVIRSKGDLEMTELKEIDLRLDGFVYHNKKLNVENPESPGSFISADVRDPAFETVPNVYTEAANTKSVLRVLVKLGYRAGVLERIYVMDHGGHLDADNIMP